MRDYFRIREQSSGLHAMPARNGWKRRIGKRRANAAKACDYRLKLQNPEERLPGCNPFHSILQLPGKRQPIVIFQYLKFMVNSQDGSDIKFDFPSQAIHWTITSFPKVHGWVQHTVFSRCQRHAHHHTALPRR